MISVLITVYNLEKYVKETLDSVLAQKLDCELEILVGDDGSSDGTVKIVKEFEKKTEGIVRLFIMPRDGDSREPAIVRASRNRINLAKHARGDYLVFLDGDDFFVNDRSLQRKIDMLERSEYSGCVMCGSNFNCFYQDTLKTVPSLDDRIKRNPINRDLYWRSGLWIHAEAFVIRNVIDFNRIKDEYVNDRTFDDNLIVFSYLKHGDICYIDSSDVNYRQNSEGYFNQGLEKQVFLNMMDYVYTSGFRKRIDQELRYYPILRMLVNKEVVISDEMLKSAEDYGILSETVKQAVERYDINKLNNRINWLGISIAHVLYTLYSMCLLYGFYDVLSKIGKKLKGELK